MQMLWIQGKKPIGNKQISGAMSCSFWGVATLPKHLKTKHVPEQTNPPPDVGNERPVFMAHGEVLDLLEFPTHGPINKERRLFGFFRWAQNAVTNQRSLEMAEDYPGRSFGS